MNYTIDNIDDTHWNCPKCMAILSKENPKCGCGYPSEEDYTIWLPATNPDEWDEEPVFRNDYDGD